MKMCQTCPFRKNDPKNKYANDCADELLKENQIIPHTCLEYKDYLGPVLPDEPPCIGHLNWLKQKIRQ